MHHTRYVLDKKGLQKTWIEIAVMTDTKSVVNGSFEYQLKTSKRSLFAYGFKLIQDATSIFRFMNKDVSRIKDVNEFVDLMLDTKFHLPGFVQSIIPSFIVIITPRTIMTLC
jgi:hypothetical protein